MNSEEQIHLSNKSKLIYIKIIYRGIRWKRKYFN